MAHDPVAALVPAGILENAGVHGTQNHSHMQLAGSARVGLLQMKFDIDAGVVTLAEPKPRKGAAAQAEAVAQAHANQAWYALDHLAPHLFHKPAQLVSGDFLGHPGIDFVNEHIWV